MVTTRSHPAVLIQGKTPQSVSSFGGHLGPRPLQSPPRAPSIDSNGCFNHGHIHVARRGATRYKRLVVLSYISLLKPQEVYHKLNSEKVALQAARDAEAMEARKAKQNRKAVRLRKQQEIDSADDGDGNEGSDNGGNGVQTTFSTRVIQSKPAMIKEKGLIERDARVPLSSMKNTRNNNRSYTEQERGHSLACNDGSRARHERGRSPHHRQATQTMSHSTSIGAGSGSLSPLPAGHRAYLSEVPYGAEDEDEDEVEGEETTQARDHLRSTSPEDHGSVVEAGTPASHKRRASSSPSLRSAQVPRLNSNGGRPKAGDYDDVTQEYIYRAIALYRVTLSTLLAFPNHQEETLRVRTIWKMTCDEFNAELCLTPRIAKVIANRGSHLRGELKTKARPLVEAFFGFESGQNRKIIAKNRERAEWLKEHSRFVYKNADDDIARCTGLYQNKLIQKVVNAMWFQDKQDEGVLFVDDFRPFPIPALALVLSVIECCLDEWMTGIRTSIDFSSKLYGDIYAGHQLHIEEFKDYATKNKARDLLESILTKLHNRGRFNAGAQPISALDLPKISQTAFAAAVQQYLEDPKTDTDGENGPSDTE
ncbi:hypothetical protein LshimejAT787_0705000 [Lyophyllum shimeji]|uniref:DUF6532 domain-containing protein n=1 Tax=Lyophyllum shimeji TaxID=47721 RepID=A0A9P3PNT0_LYOSH|nr:hypothetical protein LshimejAT787_0703570 [Lyophyllum shimeji]GLB39990.1 hypothetical protein LshimejAT787_0705000 [Lyophyllum shimeji]